MRNPTPVSARNPAELCFEYHKAYCPALCRTGSFEQAIDRLDLF